MSLFCTRRILSACVCYGCKRNETMCMYTYTQCKISIEFVLQANSIGTHGRLDNSLQCKIQIYTNKLQTSCSVYLLYFHLATMVIPYTSRTFAKRASFISGYKLWTNLRSKCGIKGYKLCNPHIKP